MNVPPPGPSGLLNLRTTPFAHYGIAWSPFHPHLFALASSANYGLIGNGRVHIVGMRPGPTPIIPSNTPGVTGNGLQLDRVYNTQDGLYDVAWSEVHENQLVSASGDGSLKLWDITINDLPIRAWHEHGREVFSVDWSNTNKEIFASSSWDGSIKVWTPERPTSVQTVLAHGSCVYQALFSPHTPFVLASCSTDGTMKIFDLRQPTAPTAPQPMPSTQPPTPDQLTRPAMIVPAHPTEILSLDWNKYRPWVLATGSVDKTIKIWDCRSVKLGTNETGLGAVCEANLHGHEYAVRKVQWSPHRPDVLASASYDMSCRIWSTAPNPQMAALRAIHDPHTEFVAGCAWSLYNEGMLASCSWDHSVHVFRPNIGI
ncbi:WD40 repeat-like protein [Clavulina sp. PMI_390]|nr:WD40 repeat-like protein [Clavulina sp. PMI_390]